MILRYGFLARFVLRDWRRHPLRHAVTLLGVALGSGLAAGVRLTHVAALDSFQEAIRRTAGDANLRLTHAAGPFPERLLEELAWTRAVARPRPVVEGRGTLEGRPSELLIMLGVDLLRDAVPRGVRLEGKEGKPLGREEVLSLLPDPGVVFLPASLALRADLQAGDAAVFRLNDRAVTLRVGGVFGDGERAGPEGTVVMDLAAAQKHLGRLGTLDRVEWAVEREPDRRLLERELQRRLPPGFRAEHPTASGEASRVLRAFQTNLTALSFSAVLVAAYLVANTLTLAVGRRTRYLAVFRALGTPARALAGAVLLEACVLAGGGCVVGAGLALLLGKGSLALTAGTLRDLYGAPVLSAHLPSLGEAAPHLSGAFLLTLAASLFPARRALRIPPGIAVRGGADVPPNRKTAAFALGAAACATLAGAAARLPAAEGPPLFGYLGAALLLAAAVLATPPALALLVRVAGGTGGKGFPPLEGRLAACNLEAGLRRAASASAALAAATALVVGMAVLVGSFRSTVRQWLAATLHADLYVRPDQPGRPGGNALLSAPVLEALETAPGVGAVERLCERRLRLPTGAAVLLAADLPVRTAQGGGLWMKEGGEEALQRAASGGAVLVSESFAVKHGVEAGENLSLPLGESGVLLPVVGIFHDYAREEGTVLMDLSLYRRLTGDDAATHAAVYLEEGADAGAAREGFLAALPPGARVSVRTHARLRREVFSVFDRTFAVTHAMVLLTLGVALLAVGTTLSGLVLERAAEIAVVRTLGASREFLRRVLLWEAGLLGAAGLAAGAAAGAGLALLLVRVIHVQSFGWSVELDPPWSFLAAAALGILASTVLAGTAPARRAASMPVARVLAKE